MLAFLVRAACKPRASPSSVVARLRPLAAATTFSSSTAHSLLSDVQVLRVPQLAPDVSSVRIKEWHVKPMDELEPYHLIVDVGVSNVTERVDDELEMQIETVDEGVLVALLKPAADDRDVAVGTPIAVVAPDEETAEAVIEQLDKKAIDEGMFDACKDAYWQAYTKGKSLDM